MIRDSWAWTFDGLIGVALVVNFIVLVHHVGSSASLSGEVVATVLYFISLLALRLRSGRGATAALIGMFLFTTLLVVVLSRTFGFLVFVDLGVLGLRLPNPWLQRIALPLIAWVLWLLYPSSSHVTWQSMISALIASAGSFGLGWVIRYMQEVNERQNLLVEQLSRANEELATSRLRDRQLAMLEERTRIARDLHDTLGNALTAITLQLEALTYFVRSQHHESALDVLTETKALSREATRQLRSSVTELRRSLMSLERELHGMLEKAQERQNWTTQWDVNLAGDPPSTELNYAVLRIGQELLTNIERHARASSVGVMLHKNDEGITLSIRDDGQGFDPARIPSGHFGLAGIRERVASLGGAFDIASKRGSGTRVTVTLPTTQGQEGTMSS